MITSMRECVAYNDLWPWPISSRSFGLGLENRVRSVASTVLEGFFPYLIQMISSMRRCVACDDLWPWPISSRSFDLDFENRVRSVASTVLDGFFPYLVQMITSMRRCVACDDLWPWLISSRSFFFFFFFFWHKFSMIYSLLIPACVCHFPPYSLNYLLVACPCLEFLYISKLWYIFMASTKICIGVPDWPCHRNFNKISTVIRADTLSWVLD